MPRSSRRRPSRSSLLRRWLAVGSLVLVAVLYYRPLTAYLHARAELARRSAEVRGLQAERRSLEGRLAGSTSIAALGREARRLGLVKPGERLFIVKGIGEWRRAQRATIRRHG